MIWTVILFKFLIIIFENPIHQEQNVEKATVVSRHGLSILNVSLFHLESYSRTISIQAQYFDLQDFEIILYSVNHRYLRL